MEQSKERHIIGVTKEIFLMRKDIIFDKFGLIEDMLLDENVVLFEEILDSLGIDLEEARKNGIGFHNSGVFDENYVTFALHQTINEHRDQDVTCKTVLKTQNIQRFVNFLCPNTCSNNAANIDFETLKKYDIETIGLFGTKQEILDGIERLGFAESSGNQLQPSLYVNKNRAILICVVAWSCGFCRCFSCVCLCGVTDLTIS